MSTPKKGSRNGAGRRPKGAGDPRFSVADREDRLVWIFGSSRSGTTWLLRMLSDVADVVPIDDPHLGHHLGVWRPIPLAWAAPDRIPELTTLLELKRDKPDYFFSDRYREHWLPALRELVATRLDAQVREVAGEQGIASPIAVVKEPGSHAADLILSMFPGSCLLFLLRDGRDVVDSWLDAYRPGSWALEEGAYPVRDEDRLAFVRWQSSVWLYRTEIVQRAFEGHDPRRRLLFRYEDLRRDPAGYLEQICSRFGIRAAPNELEAIAERHAFSRTPGRERGSGRTIRFAQPGRWRESLSEAEEAAMLEIMGDKLEELGYLSREPVARLSEAP
jgi:hypothetical protein